MSIAQRNLICRGKGMYSTNDGQFIFIKRGCKWFVFDIARVVFIYGRQAVPMFPDGHLSLSEARSCLCRKTGNSKYLP